jgi:hypothetical protein
MHAQISPKKTHSGALAMIGLRPVPICRRSGIRYANSSDPRVSALLQFRRGSERTDARMESRPAESHGARA